MTQCAKRSASGSEIPFVRGEIFIQSVPPDMAAYLQVEALGRQTSSRLRRPLDATRVEGQFGFAVRTSLYDGLRATIEPYASVGLPTMSRLAG